MAKINLEIDTTFCKVDTRFLTFWGQKSRFLDFLKVILDLLRNCLGIVFGLKRPILSCRIDPNKILMTTKIDIGEISASMTW